MQGIEREGFWHHGIKGNLNQVWQNIVALEGLLRCSLTKILFGVLPLTPEK